LFLEIVDFFIFGGAAKQQRWAGGAQRPVGRGNEPKKTGARSARARTRGQNPLVVNSYQRKIFCITWKISIMKDLLGLSICNGAEKKFIHCVAYSTFP
jgi:hypothetical protein